MILHRPHSYVTALYAAAMRLSRHAKLGFALPLALAACSPAPMPISQSSRDPSNPNAPEGVPPVVPAVPSATPSASASGHAGHEHHADDADGGAVTYVCPMHPEVSSTSPGVCPKCNMKLIPKK